jgi:predicted RNA-binding Zn-ribbon protein involved in translation (DUF1610 family)
MAIKIIKHGEKVFKAVCPVCGCAFEYEYEDILKEYSPKTILCPDCGNIIIHHERGGLQPGITSWPEHLDTITSPGIIYNDPKYYSLENNLYDCDKCPNKPDFKNGKFVVGDGPCTLCPKNKPYCIVNPCDATNYTVGSSKDTTNLNFSTDNTAEVKIYK